jgi:hypothetical protein
MLAAFLAGVNRMPWRAFLIANAGGGIIWTAVFGIAAPQKADSDPVVDDNGDDRDRGQDGCGMITDRRNRNRDRATCRLYVACWGTGDLRPRDPSNRARPRRRGDRMRRDAIAVCIAEELPCLT